MDEVERARRCGLQFVSKSGSLWRHGPDEEEITRKAVERLSTHFGDDVAIGMIAEDSSMIEWAHRPAWATDEQFVLFDEKNHCNLLRPRLGSISPSRKHRRSRSSEPLESSESGPTSPSSCPEDQVYIVEHARASAGALNMASKIEVTVVGTKEETLAAASKVIDAYFDGLKAQSEKVVAAAKGLFAKFPNRSRLPVSALVPGIVIELGMPDDLSSDMIVSILKTAGFVNAGERGPKGIGLPGSTDEAPAAAATPAVQNGTKVADGGKSKEKAAPAAHAK